MPSQRSSRARAPWSRSARIQSEANNKSDDDDDNNSEDNMSFGESHLIDPRDPYGYRKRARETTGLFRVCEVAEVRGIKFTVKEITVEGIKLSLNTIYE